MDKVQSLDLKVFSSRVVSMDKSSHGRVGNCIKMNSIIYLKFLIGVFNLTLSINVYNYQ